MYDTIILRTIARLLLPILIMLSLFMLIRGHNLPGGGFIGGLLASCGIIIQIIAFGFTYAKRVVMINYLYCAGIGILIATVSGLFGIISGGIFLQGLWLAQEIPGIGKVGTPLLFDIGIYLTVIGVTTQLALMLAEEPILYPLTDSEPREAPEAGR